MSDVKQLDVRIKLRAKIVSLSDILNAREIRVVAMYDEGKTLDEIGREIGVSKQRVQQIADKAKRKQWHFVQLQGYDFAERFKFFGEPSMKLIKHNTECAS